MDSKQYINSGMLEAFCLGCLDADGQNEVMHYCEMYPEVRLELLAIETSMQHLAESLAAEPRPSLKDRIMDAVFASAVSLDDLPETSPASLLEAWLNGMAHLIPAEHTEPFFHHLLRHDEQIMQALVVSKINIPEETHEDVIESFFILEGRCRCIIDATEYILGPGDFIEIPLHTNHDVELLTPYVTAIHQQKALPGKMLA